MPDDCIAVALGLPQLKILKQKELGDHFEVTVIYRQGEATCPQCGEVTNKEDDRRLRDKVVFLTLIKRRFRRLWCGKVIVIRFSQLLLLPQLFNIFLCLFTNFSLSSGDKVLIRLSRAILPCPDYHRHRHSVTEDKGLLPGL